MYRNWIGDSMDLIRKIKSNLRLTVQIVFTALTNGYFLGFAKGKIYQGDSKQLCVPELLFMPRGDRVLSNRFFTGRIGK